MNGKRSTSPFFIARLVIRPLLASDVALYGAPQCVLMLRWALWSLMAHL